MHAQRVAAALLPALFALLAGCGTPSTPVSAPDATSTGCPATWEAAVLWSSESEPESSLTFVNGTEVVGRQTLPFQGLEAAPTDGLFRHGDDVWMKSNGNANRDRTNILRFSTRTCGVRAYPVSEPMVRALAATDEAFFTTNTLNGVAEVRRRDLEGKILAEKGFPNLTLTALVPHESALLALGATMGTDADEGVLLELDAATLAEKRRLPLAGIPEAPFYATVRDGVLHYPRTVVGGADGSGREGTDVGALKLADGTEQRIATGAPAPFLLEESGSDLVVGHTFMNPGFRDMAEYRTITRLASDGQRSALETDPGLLDMRVAGGKVLALTQAGASTKLTTYALPDLRRQDAVGVPSPSGDRHYLAGLITREA